MFNDAREANARAQSRSGRHGSASKRRRLPRAHEGISDDGASLRVTDVSLPGGQTTHLDYFPNVSDRRLQQITHRKADASQISRFAYAYDTIGNITNWSQELGSVTETWAAGYDAADRLTSALAIATRWRSPPESWSG